MSSAVASCGNEPRRSRKRSARSTVVKCRGSAAKPLLVLVPLLKAPHLPLPQLRGNLDGLVDVQRGKPLRPIVRRRLSKQYPVLAIEVFAGDCGFWGGVFVEESRRSFRTRD